MTSSPPTTLATSRAPEAEDGPPCGGLGPDVLPQPVIEIRSWRNDQDRDDLSSFFVETITTWYLATCHRCGGDMSEPFMDLIGRDEWAVKHCELTGHLVHLGVDGESMDRHQAAMLRYFAHGTMWRWACPAVSCASLGNGAIQWHGPYDSGQLAMAAWREHGVSQ
jgi:hypothetical protein